MKTEGPKYFVMSYEDLAMTFLQTRNDFHNLHNELVRVNTARKKEAFDSPSWDDYAEMQNLELLGTMEGLRRKNLKLQQQVLDLENIAKGKNLDLEALGYISCTGGCGPGSIFKDKSPEEGMAFVRRAMLLTLRLFTYACNYYYRKGTLLKFSIFTKWQKGMIEQGCRHKYYSIKGKLRRLKAKWNIIRQTPD